jgi:hypothetical protein
MQNLVSGLRRMSLPRTRVNRGAGGPRRKPPPAKLRRRHIHWPVYTKVRTHAPRNVYRGYGICRGRSVVAGDILAA